MGTNIGYNARYLYSGTKIWKSTDYKENHTDKGIIFFILNLHLFAVTSSLIDVTFLCLMIYQNKKEFLGGYTIYYAFRLILPKRVLVYG